MWRVVVSSDMKDSLAEIQTSWSFVDLFEAQVMLDLLDALRPRKE